MEHVASGVVVFIGVLSPVAFLLFMFLKRKKKLWPLFLIGSAAFSYLMIFLYIEVYSVEMEAKYKRTLDPAIRRAITSDASNGMAIVFGWIATILWSVVIFVPVLIGAWIVGLCRERRSSR
ncbi:MAG: hypothetical protein AAF226_05790 [Verrucomicrobiota bacterium]